MRSRHRWCISFPLTFHTHTTRPVCGLKIFVFQADWAFLSLADAYGCEGWSKVAANAKLHTRCFRVEAGDADGIAIIILGPASCFGNQLDDAFIKASLLSPNMCIANASDVSGHEMLGRYSWAHGLLCTRRFSCAPSTASEESLLPGAVQN